MVLPRLYYSHVGSVDISELTSGRPDRFPKPVRSCGDKCQQNLINQRQFSARRSWGAGSRYATRIGLRLSQVGVGILVAYLGLLFFVQPARAQSPIPHPLVDRSFCLVCHETGKEGAKILPEDHSEPKFEVCTECHLAELETEAGLEPSIPMINHSLVARTDCLHCHARAIGGSPLIPEDHSERTNTECQECHLPLGGIGTLVALNGNAPPPTPIPVAPAAVHPRKVGEDQCVVCHATLNEAQAQLVTKWQNSIHAERNVGCVDCHGGDPNATDKEAAKSPAAGYIGVPDPVDIPASCATCHADPAQMRQYDLPTDQFAKYQESVHGVALYGNHDTNVATCVSCHGAHETLAVDDPGAAVYASNVPALCASCHTDKALMSHYGLATNQYDLYKDSVHGIALLQKQDLRAPTCATCHGTHGAAPPGFAEVANVCGSCHSATQDHYLKSAHAQAGLAGPRCVSCHGRYDVTTPDETIFVGTADRHCGSCHAPETKIGREITQYHDALANAASALGEAEEVINQAARLGMIVVREEGKLLDARTALIRARAAQHETALKEVTDLTETSLAASQEAREIAEQKLAQNVFRRQAMAIAVVAILVTIVALYSLKRELDRRLD